MGIALVIRPTRELVAQCGPLRTIQSYEKRGASSDVTRWLPVGIHPSTRPLYALAVHEGAALRRSTISTLHGATALRISLTRYAEPGSARTLYALTIWTTFRKHVTDHPVRAVAEAEYERQVRAEFARPEFTRGGTGLILRSDVA